MNKFNVIASVSVGFGLTHKYLFSEVLVNEKEESTVDAFAKC